MFSVPFCPLELTVMFVTPAVPAGVTAVIDVLLMTATFVAAAVPNVTVAGATKLAPEMVTGVPPEVAPMLGETPVTTGAAA